MKKRCSAYTDASLAKWLMVQHHGPPNHSKNLWIKALKAPPGLQSLSKSNFPDPQAEGGMLGNPCPPHTFQENHHQMISFSDAPNILPAVLALDGKPSKHLAWVAQWCSEGELTAITLEGGTEGRMAFYFKPKEKGVPLPPPIPRSNYRPGRET